MDKSKDNNDVKVIDVSKLDLRYSLDTHYALCSSMNEIDKCCDGLFSCVENFTYNILLFFACEILNLTVLRFEDGRHHFISRSYCGDVPKVNEIIKEHEVFPFCDVRPDEYMDFMED